MSDWNSSLSAIEPDEATIRLFERAMITSLTAVSEMEIGAYVQVWPGGIVCLELDNVSITSLARALGRVDGMRKV